MLQWLTSGQQSTEDVLHKVLVKETRLLQLPQEIFISLHLCIWWVCGILFKILQQPMK